MSKMRRTRQGGEAWELLTGIGSGCEDVPYFESPNCRRSADPSPPSIGQVLTEPSSAKHCSQLYFLLFLSFSPPRSMYTSYVLLVSGLLVASHDVRKLSYHVAVVIFPHRYSRLQHLTAFNQHGPTDRKPLYPL